MSLPKADDILTLLLARRQETTMRDRRTGMPHGWGLWLRMLRPLPAPVYRDGMLAVLAQRPLPGSPGRLPQLGTLQAMRRLLWQHWDPPPRDQRGLRIGAAFSSGLLHVCFAALLLWVALVRPPFQPTSDSGEEGRVQVAFLGDDGPEGQGEQASSAAGAEAVSHAQPSEPAPSPAPARPAAAAEPAPAVAAQPAPPPSPPEPAPVSEPAPSVASAPPVEQPVQVTETPMPTGDFVLPPVTRPTLQVTIQPRLADAPAVREREVAVVQRPVVTPPVPRALDIRVPVPTRDVQVRERTVTTVEQPTITPQVRTPAIDVQVAPRDVQVRERQVQVVEAPVVRAPVIETPINAPAPRPSTAPTVRERGVVMREPAPAAPAPTPAPAREVSRAAPAPAPSSQTPPRPAPAAAPPGSTSSSAGRATQPAAGNWARQPSDDWGAPRAAQQGARQASANGDGLFNADGSVRVPGSPGEGDAPRGAPGGDNDVWTRDQIAQSGTWLKRPPYEHTPTSFDQYWAPNASLLADWVRRGIKKIEIPIPGTSTKISCLVSTLQFGGGCGLTNPNMNDQPATARPPPDVPFKPELQEDNGSR